LSAELQELAHDHRELSGLLVAVHEALARIEKGTSKLDDEVHELTDGIEAFREELLEHFAREQEGAFPFISARIPAERTRIDALIAEHDRIAESINAIVREVHAFDVTAWGKALARFESLYAEHSKSEVAFFTDVTRAMDEVALAELRALLAEP
jgi:iron-sulfur cluster repair protein YtfE (RIC family)